MEKGQVIIPENLRKKFGIKIGTKIIFEDTGDGIKMIPITKSYIRNKAGFLGTGGKLKKILMIGIKIENKQ